MAREDYDESIIVLAALAYFAPQGTDPFGLAVGRACMLLQERNIALTPQELFGAADEWRPLIEEWEKNSFAKRT